MNKIIFLLFAVVLLVGGFAWYKTTLIPEAPKQQTKPFESKLMKFKITLPQELSVEEKNAVVTIKNTNDTITISRIGSNFPNIDSHLANVSVKNKLKLKDKCRYF